MLGGVCWLRCALKCTVIAGVLGGDAGRSLLVVAAVDVAVVVVDAPALHQSRLYFAHVSNIFFTPRHCSDMCKG